MSQLGYTCGHDENLLGFLKAMNFFEFIAIRCRRKVFHGMSGLQMALSHSLQYSEYNRQFQLPFVRFAVMAIVVKIEVTWVMTLKFNACPSTLVLSW
jgi:hypothetical protein